jgi:exopolysaccharide production protein ExoY
MSFEPVKIISDLPRSDLARPDFARPEFARPEFARPVDTDILIQGAYRSVFKRLIDLVLVILAAPFVLMIILPLAIYILRDGHSPIYWSERVGQRGRIFRMMKLRTMVPDADARLEAYLAATPEAAAEWQATQKLKADPRVTAFGRFLRKTSLDELPQLWNVLKGEMSLVGPRPMMPNQRKLYPGRAYYALRPGVTGPWQVSDRNESTFVRRADYDLDYSRNVTLAHDMGLIWRTLAVVLRGTGY